MSNVNNTNARGSEWRRWDPHMHAPGTLLNDQFGSNWESYLTRIEEQSPVVEALGVTDYFCISTYRAVRKYKAAGRIAGVQLLFPNVEMRLDIKTAKQKPINIHFLFSPGDPHHENEIERILAQLTFEFEERNYRCSLADLADLGRAVSKETLDDQAARRAGASQFKVTLADLRRLFRTESWMRQNCLVAVAGAKGDGTSGLQDDDSFTATRREIERFAHIIFAATPSHREFWLGKRQGSSVQEIEMTYGALKPCLHGSDAHRDEAVAAPDMDRYCWLKGDPTFETLRQAVIEPDDRVWIGPTSPPRSPSSLCVSEVQVANAPWLNSNHIELNTGLIAIIGARGSGKTALADIIAAGANAIRSSQGQSSFLRRAADPVNYVGAASVELTWVDGSKSNAPLDPRAQDANEDYAEVAYLSQHFVEQLCSASGLAIELREEMEGVVYEATDPTDRLEASSFDELSDIMLEPIHRRREDLRHEISAMSERVVHEEALREGLVKGRKDAEALQEQIEKNRRDLQSMIPKGNEQRAQQLGAVEKLCADAEARIEALGRRRKQFEDLAAEVTYLSTRTEPARHADMRRRFNEAKLTDTHWEAFRMQFAGDPAAIIAQLRADLLSQVAVATSGTNPVDLNTAPSADWPLVALRAKREALKREVGIDDQRRRRYTELQKTIGQQEATLRRIAAEILNAEGADSRRAGHIASRRRAYADIFATLADEEEVLTRLYSPLKANLSGETGTLGKLQFVVRRRVGVAEWVRRGEDLIDLRKETRFRGHGALQEEAEKYLLAAWRTGSAEDVATAMDAFRSEFQKDLIKAIPASVMPEQRREWVQQVAAWLYDTSHIRIEYGIEYDGVAIEQLSPGTRGIVLLLLYLAVDRQDQRPLIIDQPEENLDPNSVFQELVPHFREARKRRQVIVVTHNANLVVNTDAEQVIVAESVRTAPDALPTISYHRGSLEDGDIRKRVCEILEGGERAFLERERRYRLRWDAMVTES
ncbi:MAG TPA: AAA family ATPase [Thermoanaerobaculia bacterium]|nr:AAA family ATPase [Thermoanaerobaculia bacterium]